MITWKSLNETLTYKMSKREYVWTFLGIIGFFILVFGMLVGLIISDVIFGVSISIWLFSIDGLWILSPLFIIGSIWVGFAIKRVILYNKKPDVKSDQKPDNK
jgi:uncharacterized membrane protein